jgi:hypothetical protein
VVTRARARYRWNMRCNCRTTVSLALPSTIYSSRAHLYLILRRVKDAFQISLLGTKSQFIIINLFHGNQISKVHNTSLVHCFVNAKIKI